MYQCLASDWDSKVEKKIQSIIRQVNKYGFSAEYKVINREVKDVPFYKADANIKTYIKNVPVEVVNYKFSMPDFIVGNYTPVAVIEHNVVIDDNKVNNIVHIINNYQNVQKEWYTIDGHCDDCNDNYSRKKTVILLNNDNRSFRQIGTSCLKRYLGITCFNVIHNFMTVEELVEEEPVIYADDISYYEKKYIKTNKLLAYVYAMYRTQGGYIKGKTIKDAWDAAVNNNSIINSNDIEDAERIINFFKTVDIEEFDNFSNNIRTAVIAEYATCSGYIGYAPMLYKKLIEKVVTKQEQSKSNYVGNIKDKIELNVKVINCASFESDYGYMYINVFKDINSDNVFVWTTATKSFDVGYETKIKGTIKDHREYNNVKQTVLTRVKEI